MKKLLIVLVLFLIPNICFAFTPIHKIASETAKIYLQPGQHLHDVIIDATGFAHGIEMNVPGAAYVTNVTVRNAGQAGKNNGRGIIAFGAGVHIIINGTLSENNSEDGFRAINGAKMTIINSRAANNKVIGFFIGAGSAMDLVNSTAVNSEHGVMGVEEFTDINITGGEFYKNSFQGLQFWEGDNLQITHAAVHDNGPRVITTNQLGGTTNYGGIALHGIKNAKISDTYITDNYQMGMIAASNSIHPDWKLEEPVDAPTRLLMERVQITGHPKVAVLAEGDSVVTILDSFLEGSCLEEQDVGGSDHWGIITVDGKPVLEDGICP